MLYTAWYDDVLVDVTGCQPDLALKHIKQAVIDFCDKSLALVKDLEEIIAAPGYSTYTLVSPSPNIYDLAQIMNVYIDGKKIDVITRDDLVEKYGDVSNTSGTPKFFYQETLDEIILFPTPDTACVIGIKAAIKPTSTNTEIDDWIGIKFFDGIAHGAKARLFEIPKKPWSDLALSSYHAAKFDSVVYSARNFKSSGMARGPSRVKVWL